MRWRKVGTSGERKETVKNDNWSQLLVSLSRDDLPSTKKGLPEVLSSKRKGSRSDHVNKLSMVLGVIILILSALSFITRIPEKSPYAHGSFIFSLTFIFLGMTIPFTKGWIRPPIVLFVSLLSFSLSWFRFFQNATRFSESTSMCVPSLFVDDETAILHRLSCRNVAKLTGMVSMLWEVLSITTSLMKYVKKREQRFLFSISMATFGGICMYAIHDNTKDGSDSDLTSISDDNLKCQQMGLMPPMWRGALNDLAAVVAMVAYWQSMKEVMALHEPNKWKYVGRVSVTAVLGFLSVVLAVHDSVRAHGSRHACEYGLPSCSPEEKRTQHCVTTSSAE